MRGWLTSSKYPLLGLTSQSTLKPVPGVLSSTSGPSPAVIPSVHYICGALLLSDLPHTFFHPFVSSRVIVLCINWLRLQFPVIQSKANLAAAVKVFVDEIKSPQSVDIK